MSIRRHWVIERSGALWPEQLTGLRFPHGGRPTEYAFAAKAPDPRIFATEGAARVCLSHMPADLREVCRVVERP